MPRRAPTASPCRYSTTTRAATVTGRRKAARSRRSSMARTTCMRSTAIPAAPAPWTASRRADQPRPTGAIMVPAASRAAHPRPRTRPDSWPNSAVAGSTIGGRTGAMSATRSSVASGSSASSMAPTWPMASASRASTWAMAAPAGAGCPRRWCSAAMIMAPPFPSRARCARRRWR